MRFLYALGAAVIAAALLVFCSGGGDGDGDDKPAGSATPTPTKQEEYSFKLDGLESRVQVNTSFTVMIDIVQGDKSVKDGDAASSKVSLLIKCGDNKIAEEKDIAAKAGKVTFTKIEVKGDNFRGKCQLTISGTVAGKAVELVHDFQTTADQVATLPLPQQPTDPNTDPPSEPTPDDPAKPGDEPSTNPPKRPTELTVGQPFLFPSEVDLKIQPNSLCKNKLLLVYYDAANNTAREVLTDGINIKSVKGAVSGLALVHAQQSDAAVPSSFSCEGGISLSISPVLTADWQVDVRVDSSAPSLTATLGSDNTGRVDKLALYEGRSAPATNFSSSADVFFTNEDRGNDWELVSANVNFNVPDVPAFITSKLDYTPPVRALVKVNLADEGSHWLYIYNNR